MEHLDGRVAVVTGAASGIGAALARRFAGAGMRVAMADVEADALDAAAGALAATGATVLAVRTDVSDGASVDALAERVRAEWGDVHLLCNNAGVGAGGPVAELTTADWEWVLGVNLWGVIHGLRAFLPAMLAHGQAGHVVNTASVAGLVATPLMAPYTASKFAVVALSESLHHELAGSPIGVSVLCPGWVDTRIHESERNRPAALGGPPSAASPAAAMLRELLANGMAPDDVAALVADAVRDRRFYVLTHPEMTAAVANRTRSIVEGTDPRLSMG